MKVRLELLIVTALFVFWAITMLVMQAEAQPKTEWDFKACSTNKCVASTLNSLPPLSAATAKLTTWQSVTYVWYRK